jgi:hypothetical protein
MQKKLLHDLSKRLNSFHPETPDEKLQVFLTTHLHTGKRMLQNGCKVEHGIRVESKLIKRRKKPGQAWRPAP